MSALLEDLIVSYSCLVALKKCLKSIMEFRNISSELRFVQRAITSVGSREKAATPPKIGDWQMAGRREVFPLSQGLTMLG
jgi:hypothetical protein